jgi:hypothetical protein
MQASAGSSRGAIGAAADVVARGGQSSSTSALVKHTRLLGTKTSRAEAPVKIQTLFNRFLGLDVCV